jgi:hypothetical protein
MAGIPDYLNRQNPWAAARTPAGNPLTDLMNYISQQQQDAPANPEPTGVPIESSKTTLQPQLAGRAPTVPGGAKPGAPGASAETSVESNQRKQSQEVRAVDRSPEEFAKLLASARADEGIQKQEEGLNDLESLLTMSDRANPPQLDLSPAMALTDSLYGTKLQSGYTKPESEASKTKRVMDYASDIQKRRAEANKSVLEAVKAHHAGTATDLVWAQLAEKLGAKQEDTRKNAPKLGGTNRVALDADRYLRGFREVPAVKDSNTAMSAVRSMQQTFAKPSWLTDAMMKANLVNAARLYPISNIDLQMFQGGPGVVERFNQIVNRAANNENLLPEDRALIAEYIKNAGEMHKRVLHQAADDYNSGMGREYGYDPMRGSRILAPAILDMNAGNAPAAASKTGGKPQAPAQGGGAPSGTIRVKRKSDGQTGNILPQDFKPELYEKL